jgi:hypothetical protein
MTGVWLLAACGGSDSPTDPDDPGGATGTRMTATIDGQPWSASTATGMVAALQFAPASGGYIILGTETTAAGGVGSSMSFTINNITGPGTYPLGVDAVSVYGGFAGFTAANGAVWFTPMSGAAGTITITTLTTTRIAGTFAFSATASTGGATGTRVVTNGVFDAPFQGNVSMVTALPDSVGGTMRATLSGNAWNAAIIAAETSLGYLSLSGINSQQPWSSQFRNPPQPGHTRSATRPATSCSRGIPTRWHPQVRAAVGVYRAMWARSRSPA